MIDEGVHFFAKASRSSTRDSAKLAREAASCHATADGQSQDAQTIGIDECVYELARCYAKSDR